jgi:hypothetical protein
MNPSVLPSVIAHTSRAWPRTRPQLAGMVSLAGQPSFADQLLNALTLLVEGALSRASELASMRPKSTLCGTLLVEGSDGEDFIESQTETSGKID